MSTRSLSLIALLAATALAADVAAQGFPFSKFRMRSLAWGPGSSVQIGSTDEGAAAISLRFVHDADCGVALAGIGHRGTRADGTVMLWDYATTPPAGESTALWSAVFRPVDSQDPIELLPTAELNLRVWVDDLAAPQSVIFRWVGASLPDPLGDSLFWMEMRADIDPARPWRATWDSRLGRVQRPSLSQHYTLDEVRAPIVHIDAPWDGARSRLLVPIAGATTIPAANLPMRIWQIVGYDVSFEHPARHQQLQFSAMYSSEPLSLPSGEDLISAFRKVLYLTTEDADGHYKRFEHRIVADGPTLDYRWAAVHYPEYGFLPWLNVHRARYPVVFEAIQARSDSFWYDCTETYRDFVDAEMGLTRIADPAYALNPDFPRAAPFVANSVAETTTDTPLPTVYQQYVDHALRLREVFDGADGRELPTFMEWQKWLKGDPDDAPYPGGVAEDPIGPGFNPLPYTGAYEAFQQPPQYAIDEIARARSLGINASVYTIPIVMNRNGWPTFDDDWFLRQRDGSYYPSAGDPDTHIVDYGAPGVAWWMANNIYDNVFDAAPDLGGVFFDVLSGGGSFLRYPAEPAIKPFHLHGFHGGRSYVDGARRLFDLVRARIAMGKATNAHPDVPFIPTETVQEYFAGHYDFGQHGQKAFPMQMQLNRLFDVLGLFPLDQPTPESSNPSPPLWNAVYHEWSRAGGLTVMLSVLGVNGPFLGGGQFDPAFPGLTWQRWGDYMRFVHALWWFQGSKPTTFQYLTGYEQYDLLVDAPGGGVTVRDPGVPQQQQLVDFLRRLHHSLDRQGEAGQFLDTGRMERPLATPGAYDPMAILQSAGPSADVGSFVAPQSPGVRHFYETFFSTQSYAVPHVLHAVWRSVETGELGIVFVNWSDQDSWWQGSFDPSLYDGFGGGGFELIGIAPDGAGVTQYVVGQGQGPTQLAWNPTTSGLPLRHHASATPGLMPARSVQVFLVRPN